MTDPDYFPKKADPLQAENAKRYPPRHRAPPIPSGEDFATLTAKHGRPVDLKEALRQSTRTMGANDNPGGKPAKPRRK